MSLFKCGNVRSSELLRRLPIDVHEGPALDVVVPLLAVAACLDILVDPSLLLLGAVLTLERLLEVLQRRLGARLRNAEPSLCHLRPVDSGKEGMLLNFVCALLACPKPLAGVSVEQLNNQVLGLDRHVHWKLQDALPDVLE